MSRLTMNHLETIHDHIGVCCSPCNWPHFHDRQEPCQVSDFMMNVLSVSKITQIEQPGSTVYLRPES